MIVHYGGEDSKMNLYIPKARILLLILYPPQSFIEIGVIFMTIIIKLYIC